MGYTKQIVCLAKSRKHMGKCVAGLEVEEDGFGDWIRPVSTPEGGQVPLQDRRYEDGQDVSVLDLVEIHFKEYYPIGCQTENHQYDDGHHWQRIGEVAPMDLVDQADTKGPLWADGDSSYNGMNDRMPLSISEEQDESLALVQPTALRFRVFRALKKRQVRARFGLGEHEYDLAVTDPIIETRFLRKSNGEYPHERDALLCISIGEPFDGYQYKLVATLIDLNE